MPGAQPRRAPVARTLSAARRGSNVPAGVPGVYRVPSVRVQTVQAADRGAPAAANPWIQGPDYTITLVPDQTGGWFWQTEVEDDGIDDATLHSYLRDGINLAATPFAQSSDGVLWCLVQTETNPGIVQASAQTLLQGLISAALVDLGNGETFGTYVPPEAEVGGSVELESSTGQLVGDLTVDGEASGASETGSAGGSLWVTTDVDVETFYAPADLMATHTAAHEWPEQSAAAFSVDVPVADLLPSGAGTTVISLHVLSQTLTEPGTAGRLPPVAIADHDAQVFNYSITATVRPPRYRLLPPVDADEWTLSEPWDGYIWDAGEYLPATFDDLIGLPAAIPSGATELYFYVDGATLSDFASGSLTTPFAAYWIDGFGNDGARNPSLGTPDAGAHLWVVWHGPTISTDDPVPGVSPASLVPAALAADGEA